MNTALADQTNAILSTLTAAGDILIALTLIAWIIARSRKKTLAELVPVVPLVVRYAFPLAFLLTLASVFITLWYSEVIGYTPCGLCWMQRIFLYPQLILLGMAWWKHDTKIADYALVLSLLGLVTAVYQYSLQIGGTELIACPASLADCASVYVNFAYGYITIPIMSATAFVGLALLMVGLKRSER